LELTRRSSAVCCRVLCNLPGLTITFHVHHTSNPNYLAVLVEYANKAGTIVQVDMNENNKGWVQMQESWGDIWRMDSAKPLVGPFSMRVRSDSGQTLVANNVIPRNWLPNTDYHSNVQFY
jgi:hypothetical protein